MQAHITTDCTTRTKLTETTLPLFGASKWTRWPVTDSGKDCFPKYNKQLQFFGRSSIGPVSRIIPRRKLKESIRVNSILWMGLGDGCQRPALNLRARKSEIDKIDCGGAAKIPCCVELLCHARWSKDDRGSVAEGNQYAFK